MISEKSSTFQIEEVLLDDEAHRDHLRARALQYRWMGLAPVADALETLIRDREQSWVWAAV